MVDIEDEFNQMISEIKKTESTSKDDSTTQSKNNSAEMTIDDAKLQLFIHQVSTTGKDYDAIEVALEIMYKYQKIKQIVNDYISSGKPYISVIDEDIRKVLEDENDK